MLDTDVIYTVLGIVRANLVRLVRAVVEPMATRSAAVRLLGWRVRIPPGTCMSVSCKRRQVEVCATGRSLVQRSPTACGVSVSNLENSGMRRPSHSRAVAPQDKKVGVV